MADSALWVAVLTGGTAVLASWVTNLGNVRAARTQAHTAALAQHRERVREGRRAAYLELLGRAHVMGELYRRVVDAHFRYGDSDPFLARVQELRDEMRQAYDPLLRAVRAISLEGPAGAAASSRAVLAAATEASRSLHDVSLGEAGARLRFDAAREAYLGALDRFAEAARTAMEAP
ncbi:hypothetical protein ACWDQO_12605 [Streptomyces sp. NPDC003703]|uniref:hypothetical protein n=1 Tax=Streptomyces sp. NPDC003283 TaxID=3364681 RepID=UPI0036C26660